MRGWKGLMASVAIATVCGSAAANAEMKGASFTYVGSWSGLTLYKQFEQPFWGKTLPEDSKGKVKVEVTTFDQMGLKGAEVYRILAKNVFDIGATVADYTVADAPEVEGLDIPMLAQDPATAKKVAMAYKPVLDESFGKRFDAHVLAVVPYPGQILFCNAEIKGLADLKGLKVRSSGGSAAEFLNAVGAESVTMAFSEVPGALQRGVIDCAVTGSLSGYSSGWHEVSKVLYPMPMGGWDDVVTAISLKKWKSLDADTQAFLTKEVEEKFEAPVWEAAKEDTQQGIACLTGVGEPACKHGKPGTMKLVPVSDADVALARKLLTEKVLPNWAGRTDAAYVAKWNDTVGKAVGLVAKKP